MSPTGTSAIVEGLRLVQRVGAGGEGEVWEARDPAGRPRACKLIRPESLADSDQVTRRAAYLRRIDHPALVRVHRSGVLDDGRLAGWGFVEMDLVQGTPLDEAPPDPHAIERLAPLAEALDLLHAGEWSDGVPLVHRDVKPGNLIETHQGEVVLVDPSTLRGLDHGPHTRVGTPLFCAPEVLRGKVTPAADVYSFAATLVALASGARGDELADLLEDPSELGLPAGVVRALSPRPSERPRSCRAVLSVAEELTRAFPDGDGWLAEPVPGLGAAPGAVDRTLVSRERGQAASANAPSAGSPVPWGLALTALLAAPVATWGSGRPDAAPAVLALCVALHLVLHAFARRSLWPALLAPPLAWADVLAERAAASWRRQDWAATLLLGGIALALLPAALRIFTTDTSPIAVTLSTLAGGLVVIGLACLPAMRGAEAVVLRLLAVPVWLLGLAILLAGVVVCLPFGLFTGRAGALFTRAGRALASAVEIVLPPRE